MRGFRRLRGRVVDETGQPVAGAWVMLAPPEGRQTVRVWRHGARVTDDPSQTTAADGSFGFDRLDAKTYAVSAATDDRYTWPELASAGEPREVILRLRQGITLVVHVAGDASPTIVGRAAPPRRDRAPIAGATVAFADRAAITDERGTATIRGLAPCSFGAGVVGADVASSSRGVVADGRSDSRGRFEVDVEPGDYRVGAGWRDPLGDRALGTRSVRADGPAVTFVLPSGATIRGRALLDGTPLPYFGLTLEPMMFSSSPIGVRTVDGRFVLPRVLPGAYTLRLLGPGTGFLVREVVVERGRDVDLGNLALPRGQRITGRVRDRAGAAVAGARVCVGVGTKRWQENRSRLQQWFDARYEILTDADGAYVLDNIARPDYYVRPLQLWATHIRAGASVVRELPATDATIDLDLVGSGRIAGIVEGLRGGHAAVHAVRPDEPARARRARLADDGRFELDDVPAPEQVAPARVTVVANETATATLVMTSSSVRLSVAVPHGRGRDLVFEPVSPGAGFDGRVRGVMNMGTSEVCVFEFVRPGEYRLSLDGTTRSITIDGAQAEQTIDLV